jgi:hypothetical protein
MNLKNPLRPNNMNKTNTPQIRFKGFTEAWDNLINSAPKNEESAP